MNKKNKLLLTAIICFIGMPYSAQAATKPTVITEINFKNELKDEKNNAEIFAFGPQVDANQHNNSETRFGTDNNGEFWQWTSTASRGGGLWLDLNQELSGAHSIGVRFSFNETTSATNGYRKIIDYSNQANDAGFYFRYKKLNFYPLAMEQTDTLFEPNVVLDLVAVREENGDFNVYSIVDGYVTKEMAAKNTNSLSVPAVVNGKSRLGFFFDDTRAQPEATTGGKAYSIKVWDGALKEEDIGIALHKPVITLKKATADFEYGGPKWTTKNYVDTYGIVAKDGKGNSLTNVVVDDSAVDYQKLGSYKATVSVEDNTGTSTSETMTVNVVDTTAPLITIGNTPLSLNTSSKEYQALTSLSYYQLIQLEATDARDGHEQAWLPNKLTFQSTFDRGQFKASQTGTTNDILITAKDSLDNKSQPQTSQLILTDNTAPLLKIATAVTYQQDQVVSKNAFLDDVLQQLSDDFSQHKDIELITNFESLDFSQAGTYPVNLSATDLAGNQSNDQTVQVTIKPKQTGSISFSDVSTNAQMTFADTTLTAAEQNAQEKEHGKARILLTDTRSTGSYAPFIVSVKDITAINNKQGFLQNNLNLFLKSQDNGKGTHTIKPITVTKDAQQLFSGQHEPGLSTHEVILNPSLTIPGTVDQAGDYQATLEWSLTFDV